MANQTDEDWLADCKITKATIIGDHFIGLYEVMYGIRVRAGKLHDGGCRIDLCCGDDYTDVFMAHGIYKRFMEKNHAEGKPILEGLKTGSDPKPYKNDPDFMKWIKSKLDEWTIDKQLKSVM